MKIVLFHLTGNANVKGAAYGFATANLLYEYDVTIASFPGSFSDRLGRLSPFAEVRRRGLDPILKPYTHSWPWKETGRIVLPKLGLSRFTDHLQAPFFVDAVVQDIDRHVAGRLPKAKASGATAVYGYEDTTVQSFRKAKALDMMCLYDLPIGYWKAAKRLLETEQKRWPDWASTINVLSDDTGKLDRKEEELKLADHIFVASTFTAQTLADYQGRLNPVHVIPYGFPNVTDSDKAYSFNGTNRLKLLFVGSLSQRKGIADVFAAANHFGNRIELTVVGKKGNTACPALDNELSKHKWISSLPHHQILQLMRKSDVLLFPSLFEGFGLVITEAMSQGVPVITTNRTAGPDLITHNENGWLVKAGSTEALQEAIERIFQQPESVSRVGLAAKAAAQKRPWEVYGRELAEAVRLLV